MAESEKPDWLGKLDTTWSLAERFGAIPIIGGFAAAGFAGLTEILNKWAPASYFAAFAIGALVFQSFALIRQWTSERREVTRRYQLLSAPKGQVNPLARTYEGQRIFMSDIQPASGVVIEGKRFIDCEIIGPANIVIMADSGASGALNGCSFAESDLAMLKDDATVYNATCFKNCHFLNCRFVKTTLMVPQVAFEHYSKGFKNANWITSVPSLIN